MNWKNTAEEMPPVGVPVLCKFADGTFAVGQTYELIASIGGAVIGIGWTSGDSEPTWSGAPVKWHNLAELDP